MSSLLETLLSNAQEFKDLHPDLNNLSEYDNVYFNVEEVDQHYSVPSTKRNKSETTLSSNFVPTFWSDTFAPDNDKERIIKALELIVEQGVEDIEDFCKLKMSSLLETLLSNAQEFKDLHPDLNNLSEYDNVYFNVEEVDQHYSVPSTKRNKSETTLSSNFVPTFWSDTFAPDNDKERIIKALELIVEQGVEDIEDFCDCLSSYGYEEHCFDGLRKLFFTMSSAEQHNTLRILHGTAELALNAEKLFTSDILLLQNKFGVSSCSATFSREQCASLVANMFYCTFPECKYRHKDLNAIRFFARSNPLGKEKLKFMLSYFEQILNSPPSGCVSFVRKSMAESDFPDWKESIERICKVAITSKLIEDLPNCLQVDFANKYIGGGVMNAGAVQEEIRFLMSPEMFVSLLLCPVMEPNEAIYINGAERYSDFSGYASKLKWMPYDLKVHAEPRDKFGRVLINVVAIDAISYGGSKKNQFDQCWIDRDINKAYVAFESRMNPDRPIATGNWGCGAFRGDKQLKALIQILAASMAGRDIIYSPFTEKEFAEKLKLLAEILEKKKVTVGELYTVVLEYRPTVRQELFDYVKKRISEMK